MDSYEQGWRARRGTWSEVVESLVAAKETRRDHEEWKAYVLRAYGPEYGQAYIERERRYRLEQQERDLSRKARDWALNEYLHSMTPRNDWVGAAWVSAEGDIFPVRYCNHSNRAEELAPHHFKAEVERIRDREGFYDAGYFLSQNKGWLRIGSDGLVGDHAWNRVREIPNRQFDAIWEMHERGKARGGAHDYSQTGGFLGGLLLSIRFAMGEVNENGETPEEVEAREERRRERARQYSYSY